MKHTKLQKGKNKLTKMSSKIRIQLKKSYTHGFIYIFNHKLFWFERFFWAICFVGSILLSLIMLAPLYDRIKSSPSVLSVEKDYFNWNVSYPAITLCPTDKIDTETLRILSTNLSRSVGINVTSYLVAISQINMDNIGESDFSKLSHIKAIHPNQFAELASMLFREFDLSSLSTNTNWPLAVSSVMTELGMCHVINSNVAVFDDPLHKRGDSKVKYLKNNVQLTVHDADFFAQIIQYNVKYKIFIHHPDEVAHVTLRPYTSNTKGFLKIGLHVSSVRISKELKETNFHVRKCRSTEEPISDRYPTYSYSHCIVECRINTIVELCGCVPHFYKPLANEKICTLPDLACVAQYRREMIILSKLTRKTQPSRCRSGICCQCPSQCESDTYTTEEFFIPRSENTLQVGLVRFPTVRVVRNIIYGPIDVLLRAGGVINLCTGSSIISLMEIILLLIKYLIRNLCILLRIK